jgi:hypothetical protein
MTTLYLSFRENENCGLKKYVKVMSKLKKWKKHHQMKKLLVKCIENLYIYIYIYLFIYL